MNIEKFLQVATQVERLVASGIGWATKYEMIFGDDGLFDQVLVTQVRVPWVDPDASYEDDVRAWAEAVARRKEELQHVSK